MFGAAETVSGAAAIVVAAITTVGVVITAVFAYVSSRSSKKAKNALGTPNGNGDISQMVEKTLLQVGRIHQRLDDQDAVLDDHGRKIAELMTEVGKTPQVNVLPVVVEKPSS